jgi:hypothetical protein
MQAVRLIRRMVANAPTWAQWTALIAGTLLGELAVVLIFAAEFGVWRVAALALVASALLAYSKGHW